MIYNMKKRLFLVLGLFLCLTGCIKNNIDMKLETNNSFSIVITNGYQATSNENYFKEEDKQKYIDNGYKVEDYKDDGYTGVKISIDVDDINIISGNNIGVVELTTLFNTKASDIKLFNTKKIDGGTLYTANFTYNLTTEGIDSYTSSSTFDVESYQSIMDLKYSITLPVKTENNNATSNEGNTYVWNLEFGKVNEITYSFIINDSAITKDKEDYEKSNYEKSNTKKKSGIVYELFSSFLGIGILVAVIIIYYYIKKKIIKKYKKSKKKKGYHFEAPESVKEKK